MYMWTLFAYSERRRYVILLCSAALILIGCQANEPAEKAVNVRFTDKAHKVVVDNEAPEYDVDTKRGVLSVQELTSDCDKIVFSNINTNQLIYIYRIIQQTYSASKFRYRIIPEYVIRGSDNRLYEVNFYSFWSDIISSCEDEKTCCVIDMADCKSTFSNLKKKETRYKYLEIRCDFYKTSWKDIEEAMTSLELSYPTNVVTFLCPY